MPGAPLLSVVIAALDEAEVLPLLLADLAGQKGLALEVIVADGGSTDATAELARASGAALVPAPCGRASQFNAGSLAARGRHLLFLHADTRLAYPTQLAEAYACLAAAEATQPAVAGHWPLHFARTVTGHDTFFRYAEGKTRCNRPGTVNGDQGLLLSQAFFASLGGYDASLPYFEDQRLAARIFARGRFMILPGSLRTSARRFEQEGHGPRYALMALIVGMEAAGLQELMASLPALYRVQAQAGPLDLVPVLCAIHARLAALPVPARERLWAQVGLLLRQNLWQLAHALDVLSHKPGSVLDWYSRHLEPRLQNRAGLAATTAVGRKLLELSFAAARFRAALRGD